MLVRRMRRHPCVEQQASRGHHLELLGGTLEINPQVAERLACQLSAAGIQCAVRKPARGGERSYRRNARQFEHVPSAWHEHCYITDDCGILRSRADRLSA